MLISHFYIWCLFHQTPIPRMLQEDPVLFQLYKDLVVSQVISAEEFWANRVSTPSMESSLSNNKQEVGISAAFLVSRCVQYIYISNDGVCPPYLDI